MSEQCGCGVFIADEYALKPMGDTIDHCPLHAAAGELLRALYDIRRMCGSDDAHIHLRAAEAIKLAGHDPLAAARGGAP